MRIFPLVLVRRTIAAALAMLACAPAAAADEVSSVPHPSQTPAKVIVSGRTVTAVEIRIEKVGQNVPPLVPRQQGKIKNTPGFTWYVSQHYALKSSVPEEFSRHVLEISELAYPLARAIVGCEPEGIAEARMALVYGKSEEDLDRSVRDDLDSRLDLGDGGGITLYSNRVAYNYPSGGLDYHKRDLVIHENLHMFEMNTWKARGPAFREFVPLAGGNHVYDAKKKQLTLFVVDKAPTNNPYDRDLAAMRENFQPIDAIMTEKLGAKEYKMLGLQFFLTDPDRFMKWQLWRDETAAQQGRDLKELFAEIFGPSGHINLAWRQWVARRRNTFHYADWGWEQDGDTLWSYGYPQKGPYARTDIHLPPGEKPFHDPLVMDYPAAPMPAIVGQVERGGAEPSVGCVIDFSRTPGRGVAGLGLGVLDGDAAADKSSGYLTAMVKEEKELVIDGERLGLGKLTVPLPESLRRAMADDGRRVGLNAKIAEEELKLVLRAGPADATKEFAASLPITPQARERLLAGSGAVLSRQGRHGVTPYFDDRRRPPPDLTVPAPANRWRFTGLDELYGLYRAAHLLKEKAPASLVKLRDRMVNSVDAEPGAQARGLDAWKAEIARVTGDIMTCGADTDTVERALRELRRQP